MSDGNREYKSDIFSMLMQDKANALKVYNAQFVVFYNEEQNQPGAYEYKLSDAYEKKTGETITN